MSYRDSYSRSDSYRSDYRDRDRGDRDRDRDRYDSRQSRHRETPLDCKVYVGDLSRDSTEKDIHHHFGKYGTLRNVWVARNPPGFAFVEFEDPRDAEDAVRNLDGISLNNSRIRVEHSSGKVRPKPWMRRGPPRGRRPFNPDDRCFECGQRGHYAYDCRYAGSGSSSRRRTRSRSRSRSRGRRSYSRSRSRSRSASRSRSYSRSRSRSRGRGHSKRSRSRSASHHSRHSSPRKNGDN